MGCCCWTTTSRAGHAVTLHKAGGGATTYIFENNQHTCGGKSSHCTPTCSNEHPILHMICVPYYLMCIHVPPNTKCISYYKEYKVYSYYKCVPSKSTPYYEVCTILQRVYPPIQSVPPITKCVHVLSQRVP